MLLDTLAISELAAVHCNLAWRDGIRAGVRQLSGFILEGVALSALLLLDDSRYLPIPSSTRADSGYYYPQQTHDIVVINQHGGTIKKAIPSEVKAEPSVSDRRRYQAVIISKYDLGASEHSSIKNTMQAFSNVVRGRDMEGDRETVAQIRDRLMNKLEDYQRQQVTQESGRTKFYGKPQYRRGAGRAALCKAS